MTADRPGFVVPTQHNFFTVAACPWVPSNGEAVGGQRLMSFGAHLTSVPDVL